MRERYDQTDTIAAIATPPGTGGIAVIRISGPDAAAVADRIFSGDVMQMPSHTVCYGRLMDGDKLVDQVLLTLMRAPRSYTREDVVELGCHGGGASAGAVLGLCLKNGARLARPGEFTQRAFLNGRVDLTEAEAVADVVNARTEPAREAALAQLSGGLRRQVGALRERILDLTALLEAALDYPEETAQMETRGELETALPKLSGELDRLLREAADGRLLREGITVAILGKPNVGKSSLLNRLLEAERAIVTDIPGTTRDILEEWVSLDGFPVKLMDTAGVRDTADTVERLGVDRALAAARNADLLLLLLDGSRPLEDEDRRLLALVAGKPALLVVNKTDLPGKIEETELEKYTVPVLRLSARTGDGVTALKAAVRKQVLTGGTGAPAVTNPRHRLALEQAAAALEKAGAALAAGVPEDLLSLDLQDALYALGQITGETADEELIDRIFAKFCLGK